MRSTLVARVLVPAILIALAAVLILGTNSAPPWILRLGWMLGITAGDAFAVRAAAAALATLALGAALVGGMALGLARTGCAAIFCGGLATLSSLGPAGFLSVTALVAALATVAGAVGFASLAGAVARPPRKGPSHAWRIIALVAIAGTSLALAAAAPVRLSASTPAQPEAALVIDGVRYLDLDIADWEGRAIAETSLARHRPDLVESLARGRTWLVFYSPTCGSCHVLFARHFSGELTARVVAIAIPPVPGVLSAESDQEDIDCPGCERTELPSGVGWLITPPAVVLVEDGMVRCVQEARGGRNCLE
jgi:hypothetical protein